MRSVKWVSLIFSLFLLAMASGQGSVKQGVPLIVPGTGLGWDIDEIRLVLDVKEPGEYEVLLYSPGFDPKDYRSPHELGDERYDQGKGELLAVYELRQGERVITRTYYGIEPHAWHRLFSGRLLPGEYLVAARFFGNGKNAVVFTLKVKSGNAQLLLAPDMLQTYNVVRGGWQTPFQLYVPEPSKDLKVGIYDGDGPRELDFKVDSPQGELRPPVPADRAWTQVKTEEPGSYAFRFRIPKTATQHTNTVGLKVFLGKIRVEVVDTEGRPVPGAGYRIQGQYQRIVELKKPSGWDLVATHVEGGRKLAPGRVGFGMGAGVVRFVLKRTRPLGRLVIRASVACGAFRDPYPLRVKVAGRVLRLSKQGESSLELPAGVYDLTPISPPGAKVDGQVRVEVVPGRSTVAEFSVRPEVRTRLSVSRAEVGVGDPIRVRIQAETDFPGPLPAHLMLDLPEGLEARGPTSLQASLSAGHPVMLEVPVVARQAGIFTLTARARPCGRSAQATLRVREVRALHARPDLDRRVEPKEVLPGETMTNCLRVQNQGQAPLSYRLEDRIPDWLDPDQNPVFSGQLAPGGQAEHCYRLRASSGTPVEGVLEAVLKSNAGTLTETTRVRRRLLELVKSVDPARVPLGGEARFRVVVKNPLDRPVQVVLTDTPETGLGLQSFEKKLELPARGRRELSFTSVPLRTGRLTNRVQALINGVPAAQPAQATLEVRPIMRARRASIVELPFALEAEGESLLIRHAVPAGARYVPGSSRLDGAPIADPKVDEKGRLYWQIPFEKKGKLSYDLAHEKPLPPLAKPELTLIAGDRELYIQGHATRADLARARPLSAYRRWIVAPKPGAVLSTPEAEVKVRPPAGGSPEVRVNGQALETAPKKEKGLLVYHVPLAPGKNLIELQAGGEAERVSVFRAGAPKRLELVPEHPVADGRTPLRFRLRALDGQGLPSGNGLVTLEAEPEPLAPDADPLKSGCQVRLENGEAQIALRPMASPGWARVAAAFGDLRLEEKFFVAGSERRFYLAQGSVTARLAGGFELGGLARGYVESPLAGGRLQAAADLAMGQGQVYGGLEEPENPNGRFPLTGAGEEATLALSSEDGVAFRYDNGPMSVGYGRLGIGASELVGLPQSSVLAGEYRGDVQASAFVGLLPRGTIEERITPDGSRVYRLSYPARPGSEVVYLVKGGHQERLVALRDYVLDYPTGMLYLSRPLWSSDENFTPQFLRVYYAPEGAVRDRWAMGGSLGFKRGPFSLSVAAATLDLGADWRVGARFGYRVPTFSVGLGYRYENGIHAFSLGAEGQQAGWGANVHLNYRNTLSGDARVTRALGSAGRLALEHHGRLGRNETGVLYEHRFTENLFGGLGAGYLWEDKAIALLGRLGYEDAATNLRLTHSQPFSVSPETTLRARHQVDENLALRGELGYRWGQGTFGVLGLEQQLGPANLALSYQLPNASGGGNRARFGVRAPLPLNRNWTLDLSGGLEHGFTSGDDQATAGAAVRYHTERFSASLGVEGARGSAGTRASLRAGAAGSIDRRQVVSFDATYQVLPEPVGRFTLAYAYRGRAFQVLTYHRLSNAGQATLEGELAPTWHPSLSFQLRPSAAYRLFLDDPTSNTYQLGLGANYYFTRRLGLGGGVYYVFQPGTGSDMLAFSVEGSLRVLEPVWLNVGYTFGGFRGLTPEARPGPYLRLDFGTGSDR